MQAGFHLMDMMKIVNKFITLSFILILDKAKWNRIEVVRIYDILTSTKIKDFLDAWNISVHKWLKYYVFLRVVKKG